MFQQSVWFTLFVFSVSGSPAACAKPCPDPDPTACAKKLLSPRPVDAPRFAALLSLCHKGDPYACAWAGLLRHAGEGIERNSRTAVPLLERACRKDIALGCKHLAKVYDDDYSPRSVAPDTQKTRRFMTRALVLYQARCQRGDAKACFEVANIFSHGRGVPRDDAQRWLFTERACALDDAWACSRLGNALWQGAPGIELNAIRAAKMLVHACELKSEGACREAPQVVVDHVIQHPPGTPWNDGATLQTLRDMCDRELATGSKRPVRVHAAIGAISLLQGDPEAARTAFETGLRIAEAADKIPGVLAPYVFGQALAHDALGATEAAPTAYQRFIELAGGMRARAWLMLPRAQGINPTAALAYARQRLKRIS